MTRAATTLADPCTGARRRDFLLGLRHGQRVGAQVPSWCSGHGWTAGCSQRAGPPGQLTALSDQTAAEGTGRTAPCTASLCQGEVVTSHVRRPSVEQVSRIGMDTSKHIFQLHGVDAAERPVLRRKLRRRDMIAFFERLSPTRVAIEACGASHHWARLLRGFGHEVQLIAPHLVKPYVKRGKNDAADAEALCEAMSRPTMRFVTVKTAEQ